jgi:hypothetical protein
MKMIKLLTVIVFSMYLYQPVRPPEPPVPFPYDPNQVNYEIIEAIQFDDTGELWFTREVVEPDGQEPIITFSDLNIIIMPPTKIIDPHPENIMPDPNDPNNMIQGPGLIYSYRCMFKLVNRPQQEAIVVDITAGDGDPNDPRYDHRSMLFWLGPLPLINRSPVIR